MPNVKIPIDTFSLTRGSMEIKGFTIPLSSANRRGMEYTSLSGAFTTDTVGETYGDGSSGVYNRNRGLRFTGSRGWTGSTSSATPSTNSLGSGSAISYMPEYITIKLWKRIS